MKVQCPVQEAYSPELSRDAIEINSGQLSRERCAELDPIQADRMSEIVDHKA
jgi:hypothetical protein